MTPPPPIVFARHSFPFVSLFLCVAGRLVRWSFLLSPSSSPPPITYQRVFFLSSKSFFPFSTLLKTIPGQVGRRCGPRPPALSFYRKRLVDACSLPSLCCAVARKGGTPDFSYPPPDPAREDRPFFFFFSLCSLQP